MKPCIVECAECAAPWRWEDAVSCLADALVCLCTKLWWVQHSLLNSCWAVESPAVGSGSLLPPPLIFDYLLVFSLNGRTVPSGRSITPAGATLFSKFTRSSETVLLIWPKYLKHSPRAPGGRTYMCWCLHHLRALFYGFISLLGTTQKRVTFPYSTLLVFSLDPSPWNWQKHKSLQDGATQLKP